MPEDASPPELRRCLRKHIYLAAVLRAAGGSYPVCIRNMSQNGALAEARLLPEAGTSVKILRGSLEAAGRIVWSSGCHCGIAFSSDVLVDAWLPKGKARQARIDALIDNIRNENEQSGDFPTEHRPDCRLDRSAEVLALLARALGRQFASDPATIARFPFELQGLDILVQALEAIASDDSGASRRLAETVSACRELLANMTAAEGTRPEPAFLRDGQSGDRLKRSA